MRKLLAVFCGTTLLLAGCDSGPAGPSASPTPSPSASVAASPSADPALAANTKEMCGELKKVMEDQTVAFITAVSRYGQANTITDPAKKAAVVDTAKKSFGAWAKAVRALSGKAKDPALVKAIDDQAAALDDAAATLTSIDQLTSAGAGLVSPKMQAAADETARVCG